MKKINAKTFFTDTEKEKIEHTTVAIETRTIGEVVVVVTDGSDNYPEAEVVGGILLGSLLSLVTTLLFFHAFLWWYIVFSFIFYFPSKYLVKRLALVKSAFIGIERKNDAVEQMALRVFDEKGLYKTKERTGVLFFLSLFERKVWVLADCGLHEKIGQEKLDRFAQTISRGIKDGRSCDILCEVLLETGALLEKHFPMTPGDINELPDRVITD